MQYKSNKKNKQIPNKNKSPMDVALQYLTMRARTVREMERYLDDKQYGEYEIQQVIERLQELNYLNDAAYAENFISSRLNTKPVSRRKLEEQLRQHEIESDIIDEALLAVTDEVEQNNANAVAEKYASQMEDLPMEERCMRVQRRLVSRGYSFDCVKRAMREVGLVEDR